MIVKCEQCLTKFKFDPSRIKGDEAKLRCSQCGYVFTVPVEKTAPAPVEPLEKPVTRASLAHEDDLNMSNEEIERLIAMQRGMGAKRRRGGGKKLFIILSVLFVVAIGAGAYLYTSFWAKKPQLLKAPPQTEVKDESYKNIVLSSAEGYFKQNKTAGTLFVIKGVAQNKNDFPVSFIRLKGILHDTNAQAAMEREVYAGNLFTDEELKSLPMDRIKDRSAEKAGFDNANYRVPAGGAVSYMIVFDGIPDNLAEFTVKVVDSQSDAASKP